MSYTIQYNEIQEYIAVTIEGDFALTILEQLATDVASFIKQHGCKRILNDMRQAKLAKGPIYIYNMPEKALRAGVDITYRRALIVSEHSNDFHFLETVFINQGHDVKMFTDPDEALHWLLQRRDTT